METIIQYNKLLQVEYYFKLTFEYIAQTYYIGKKSEKMRKIGRVYSFMLLTR